MPSKLPRVAVRALIVNDGKLLLVNAWPGDRSPLLCAPGGGVEPGASMPENLAREVQEETGLIIEVGAPCLVNEFHDPASGFHQVEVFFHCKLAGPPEIDPAWQDPEKVVTRHYWLRQEETENHPIKPDALVQVAFGSDGAITYDPLEQIVV